jgi:dihydroorotate dehydrogenase
LYSIVLNALYPLARPLLFSMDPEDAHHFTLNQLKRAHAMGLSGCIGARVAPQPRTVMGITFPNPVGLAAGLDKDGAYIDALGALGFGFIEVGTVTPRAQPGNPRPRMFRLPAANALINRMGFNNGGVEAFINNVQASKWREAGGVLGLNIGKNADTPIERAVDDYLHCLERVYPHASYVTVNISSPNTKNLRQLQGASELDSLLGTLRDAQHRLADQHKRYVPVVLRHKMDGVIATNTTIRREAVTGLPHAEEAGGLSGQPVREGSTRVIRALRGLLGDAVPIIGVGGILAGEHAREKIGAGAQLVQLYTGLIYRGPGLVAECARALAR